MKSNEAIAMKKLRQYRRKNSECAQCAKPSDTYLCKECNERRGELELKRESTRLNKRLCIRCGKHPSMQDNERHLCYACNNIYPNLPIRKLRKWEVKNHELYHAMMEKGCSTNKLAKYIGISERTVERWVFENVMPKEDNAREAARFFNMDVSELFTGRGKL
nr:helix-turn-helix transcriptional regulator [Mycobacterium tuberculosis]